MKERTVEDIERAFYKLEVLQGVLSDKGTPQLVYTIEGKERVIMKIGEMLDLARSYFLISSPSFRDITTSLNAKFRDAIRRGVMVTIVAEPDAKLPEQVQVIRKYRSASY